MRDEVTSDDAMSDDSTDVYLRDPLYLRFIRGFSAFLGLTGWLLSFSFVLICIEVLQEKRGSKAFRLAAYLIGFALLSLIPAWGVWIAFARRPLPRFFPWLVWASVSLAITLSLGAIAADYQTQMPQ